MSLRILFAALSLQIFLQGAQAAPPAFKKVMIVVLENTDYKDAIKQPFLASLAKRGANFTHFTAETHPSQGNYIAMIAGDTLGVDHDGNVTLDKKHLGDLLEAAGKSWKVYAEDYPGNCFAGSSKGTYVRKHNPFISFKNVQSNPERCARIVDANQLEADLKGPGLPDFSFYAPNLDNDGHDTSPAFADRWMAKTFGSRIDDPSFTNDLLLVVTFDEDDRRGSNNQIYTTLIGPGVIPGSVVEAPTNHYSVLKLIEDTLGLGNLGRKDATASAITGIWR